MQLPASSVSSETLLEFSDQVEDNLASWVDSELLTQEQRDGLGAAAALLNPAAVTLRQRKALREEAERAARRADLRFKVCDKALDGGAMAVSDGILNNLAGRDRAHLSYRKVFPSGGALEITEAQMREEPALAQELIKRFDSIEDFSGKAALRIRLLALADKSLAALKVLEDAEKAKREADDDEISAFLALRQALDKSYNLIRAAFPGRRDFVEPLFPRQPRGSARARAELKGWTAALLSLLAAKSIPLSEEGQKKIEAAEEIEVIARWLARALTASSEAELFPAAQ